MDEEQHNRTMKPIATTPEIDAAIRAGAPIGFAISGGQDSDALVLEGNAELDQRGHAGPRLCIHSDLGVLAWESALPQCERLARHVGLPLVVTKRKQGDLLDRWRQRWQSNVRRYANLEICRLILPWSSPAMLFCRSELKAAISNRELIARFPGALIITAAGIRREESATRADAPIAAPEKGLESKTQRTSGLKWNPIADYTLADVGESHARHAFERNETYSRGMTRHSCKFCIMAGLLDLITAANQPENTELYRELVSIEIESTFSFQSDRWLGDIASHLLDAGQVAALAEAKERAAARQVAEARIPRHLLYERSGWPRVLPTPAEAQLLADVRRAVAAAVGISIHYTTGDAVRGRMAELMEVNTRKLAAKAAKEARRVQRQAA
jgi:3'-phosphoadenosine 5'-phosphosulfate sulfotransferase (PAPS reductase)/FAD synthetase